MLAREIDGYLAQAQALSAEPAQVPKLLLAPHAGTIYSGPVAAHAYALLRPAAGRIRRVVLLGPAHRVAVQGLAAPSVAAFDTPFGAVPVDREALRDIASLPQMHTDDLPHAMEHALEVQLPFLQRVLGEGFAIVPLVVGRASPAQVAEVIERLWGGDETLIVISSDLSHYLPYAQARARDAATINRVLALDPALDHDEACGATPLAGALIAARRHGLRPRLLDLRNSGDTAGDRQQVVGYAAVAFDARAGTAGVVDDAAQATQGDGGVASPSGAASAGTMSAMPTGTPQDALPHPALGTALLAHARHAIAVRLGVAQGTPPAHPGLEEHGATFVTLRRDGELRGCIGTLQAHRPLHADVQAHAVAAAFGDPRFEPLTLAEFDGLEIEVSVLEAAEPLAVRDEAGAHRELRPGVDGVVLEWRGARATFLPQVWSQLPRPADFLRALKRKAGLAADFWADDLLLLRYGVRKYGSDNVPDSAPDGVSGVVSGVVSGGASGRLA